MEYEMLEMGCGGPRINIVSLLGTCCSCAARLDIALNDESRFMVRFWLSASDK